MTIVCFDAVVDATAELLVSDEHSQVGVFTIDELDALPLPSGYREAIEVAAQRNRELGQGESL